MIQTFTLEAPLSPFGVLAEDGHVAGEGDRETMLSEARSGKRTSVKFQAITYIHGPNKNHTRLNTDELGEFARSFKGLPFLLDHERAQAARGGTIVDSELVELAGGRQAIRQTIKAVKPFAVEGVLDGTIDRFSIGFDAKEFLCTVHGTPFFRCGHGLADLGELDEKAKAPVEVLLKGIEGTETSAVTNPAVSGTGVLDVLKRLESVSQRASQEAKPSGGEMKEKILALLGMSADSSEEAALTEIGKRLTAPKEIIPPAMLKVLELPETAPADQAIAAVVSLKANTVARADHDAALQKIATFEADEKVEAALAARKITPAQREWARGFAKDYPEAFAVYVEKAKPQGPPLEPGKNPDPAPTQKSDEGMTELGRFVAGRMGVTAEEYAAAVKSMPNFN